MARPETTRDHPHTEREREIIVTDGRRSSGIGTAVAVIMGALLVLLVGWMLFAGPWSAGDGGDAPVIPDEMDVNINPGDGGNS